MAGVGNHMITREYGDNLAKEWIEAWKSHGLDRVLSHYADDFEMSSPVIEVFHFNPEGRDSRAYAHYVQPAV